MTGRITSRKATGLVLLLCLTVGPLTVKANSDNSCAQLSLEITNLLAQKRSLQASFWGEPGNRVAAIGAMTFTPVAYPSLVYLTLSGAKRLPNGAKARSIQARVDELRALSADQLCYVEPIYHY